MIMKSLSEVLPNMEAIAKQRESRIETSSVGLEMPTMKTETMTLPLRSEQQVASLQATRPAESSANAHLQKQQKNSALSNQETLQLLSFLDTSFAVLDTYGRKPDQLTEISKLFVVMLKGYPLEKIKEGFMQHMKRSSRMPTPADIINLIDPPPPPPWKPDWAFYVAIKESVKRGNFLSSYSPEYAYMKRCESWAMNNLKEYDEREEHQQTIAELESKIAITDQREDV